MQIALVGIGKIATDQHVPAIAASPDWTLAATVSRAGTVEGAPAYTDMATMLAEMPEIGVVSLCLPPVPRFAAAKLALDSGRHVMLEKPPGATLAEVIKLRQIAEANGLTLFATWHSRMAQGVAAAKAWLVGKSIHSARITWREDVRKWHPGQDWIFEPGGMGVLDPGINALSILTEILPIQVHVTQATLEFPANRATPIAARAQFSDNVSADFDWRQTGEQTWDIDVETPDGTLSLRMGGNQLLINGTPTHGGLSIMGEYPALYARMAALVSSAQSDVDLAPMVHVSDMMTLGARLTTDAFHF